MAAAIGDNQIDELLAGIGPVPMTEVAYLTGYLNVINAALNEYAHNGLRSPEMNGMVMRASLYDPPPGSPPDTGELTQRALDILENQIPYAVLPPPIDGPPEGPYMLNHRHLTRLAKRKPHYEAILGYFNRHLPPPAVHAGKRRRNKSKKSKRKSRKTRRRKY